VFSAALIRHYRTRNRRRAEARRRRIASENLGSGKWLDLLCGHFAVASPHDRLLRNYLPPILIVNAGAHAEQRDTAGQLAGLVALMRVETTDDHLGGRAMLNALSTAMFALVLRPARGKVRHGVCLHLQVIPAWRR
jgi:hypothetical protein